VGVGAPLGLALIAALVLLCRGKRRHGGLQQSQISQGGIDYYPNIQSTTPEKDSLLEQDGRRTTVAESRGDDTGVGILGGNLHELGGTNGR
jgi:hypothetical protein